jgi:hypothetical protein
MAHGMSIRTSSIAENQGKLFSRQAFPNRTSITPSYCAGVFLFGVIGMCLEYCEMNPDEPFLNHITQ